MSNKGFVTKLKSWIAGDPFEEDVYQLEEEFEMEGPLYRDRVRPETPMEMGAMSETLKRPRKSNLKVLDNAGGHMTQVIVVEPKSFEEALEIVDQLRARRSVVLNLHLLDTAQSQRVVDFLSGATHAIDGHQQRIGDGVFMFTPNNVVITNDPRPAEREMNLADAFWRTQNR